MYDDRDSNSITSAFVIGQRQDAATDSAQKRITNVVRKYMRAYLQCTVQCMKSIPPSRMGSLAQK